METDILLKSIYVQTDECLICYESNAPGFQCVNCFWQHCEDCHKNWLKQSKTCPQCRMELEADSDDEAGEEEVETSCCTKALFIACLHALFALMVMYVIFLLIIAGDATLDCNDDMWCFLTNLMMFLFIVSCSVQLFVKLVIHYRA